jgi:cyclic pyranopterin phosphate synthase
MPKSTYLTAEEIVRLVRVAGMLGVSRFRLTGGEPLLRDDIVPIVRALKRIETVRDLSITTNGSRLSRFVFPLKAAGLDRLNISLDSLYADRLESITRSVRCRTVRPGIELALQAGFQVKLNVVVLNGITSEEIIEFVRMAVDQQLDVRFLEFMPLCGSGWRPDLVYPIAQVRKIVRRHFDLEEQPRGNHPAQTYSIVGGKGRVGFIAPLSEPFCESCSRIRLSADGQLYPCLFSHQGISLADLMKQGASDKQLLEAFRSLVSAKSRGSQFEKKPFWGGRERVRLDSKDRYIRSIGG